MAYYDIILFMGKNMNQVDKSILTGAIAAVIIVLASAVIAFSVVFLYDSDTKDDSGSKARNISELINVCWPEGTTKVHVLDDVMHVTYDTMDEADSDIATMRCLYESAPAGASLGLFKTEHAYEFLVVPAGADFDYDGYSSIW